MKKLNYLPTDKKVEFPEINSLAFWYKLAFLADETQSLNILQTNLQGDNKLIPHMTSKIFAFEEKLKIVKS